MSQGQSSLAIVLRWRPYAESDKIVTFLTRDFGKLTGIAKGAFRSKRRFVNSLDPLARVRVHFRQRPHASLAFLESCELLASPVAFAEPSRFAYGSYLIELIDQLTADEEPGSDLYALLEEALQELEKGPATGAFLRSFELKLLDRAGFGPQLDRCASCESRFVAAPSAFLSPAHGTFLCSDCRPPGGPLVEVANSLLSRLSTLGQLSLAACRQEPLGSDACEAAQVTGRLLAVHLNRPLSSLKLIEQLGSDSI